jgi:hypothetical protein
MSGYTSPVYRLGDHQSVIYTASAGTITNAFSPSTKLVRVLTTSAAYVKVGNSPKATSADVYVPADTPQFFMASPGMKVSAVQVSSSGTLHVTELTT